MTAYVMIAMRRDKPDREWATMLMLGGNSSEVQWVVKCTGGGKEELRAGALMLILGGIGNERGMMLSGKTRERRRQQARGWDN